MRLSRVLQFEPPIPLWQLGIAAIARKHPYLSGFPIELECTREKRRELKQHLAQMGCYFLLIEEELRIRPTHGFVVCGNGTRHRIENTEELRAWVLGLAGQIRAATTGGRSADPGQPEARSMPSLWPKGQLRAGSALGGHRRIYHKQRSDKGLKTRRKT